MSHRRHRPRRTTLTVLVALAAVLALPLIAALAPAQDIRFHRIGTGTTGGTYFPIGGIIANAISGPPGAPPCELGGSCGVPGLIAVAQASTGSVENLRDLRSGDVELALSQSDVAFYGFTGSGVFADQERFDDLRGIASLYVEQVHVVVRADGEIASIADLAGRRVVLGEEGSGTLVASRLILAAHGLSEAALEPLFLSPEQAADALTAGEADAMVFVAGAPILAIEDLARRLDIRLIPVTGEGADNLMREQPYFAESTLADDTYAGVAGVETVGVSALLVTTEALDADTVYGITRALWHPTTAALLATGHPRGSEIMVDNALNAMAVPLHAGAIRYYSEIDLFTVIEPL